MDKLIKEIGSIKTFNLAKYYELVDKYGEKEVILAFKALLNNNKNESLYIINKYSEAYISMELDVTSIDSSTYSKLCDRYGDENVDKYIIECDSLNRKEDISNKITKILDFLIKNEEIDAKNNDDNEKIKEGEVSDSPYNDSVNIYLKEVGNFSLLTPDEEKKLFLRYINTTDEKEKNKIKNKIVKSNLRLVISIAKRYNNCNTYPFIDIIQDGNIGLMTAVDRYDPNRGYKFSTYATWWIKQSIMRTMAIQSRVIRLPVHLVDRVRKISICRAKLSSELGREPTEAEIANSVGISVEKLREVDSIVSSSDVVSLHTPIREEEDNTLADFIPDENNSVEEEYEKSELREMLDVLLKDLTEREQAVIKYRFGLDDDKIYTLEEIGNILGVTRERIRQVESKALRKLSHPSRSKKLKPYL